MEKEKTLTLKNAFMDASFTGILLIIFSLLGYYSREFAIDLHAMSFLDGWGAF